MIEQFEVNYKTRYLVVISPEYSTDKFHDEVFIPWREEQQLHDQCGSWFLAHAYGYGAKDADSYWFIDPEVALMFYLKWG